MGMSSKIENIFELNNMQKGMLYANLMNANSKAYYEMFKFVINGDLNIDLLEKSFNKIIERHGIFRTIFKYKSVKEPIQVVLRSRQLNIKYYNLIGKTHEKQKQLIEEYIETDGNKPYDFEKSMLMRIAAFKLENDKHQIIMNFHHIILDGWCISILMNEWFEIYYSLYKEVEPELPEKPQNEVYYQWLKEQKQDVSLEYWNKYLQGYDNHTSICGSRKTDAYTPKTYKYHISREIYDRANTIALECNSTMNTMFNVVWGKVLEYYTNTRDVVFGSVVSGRPPELTEIENMIGVFINTVPIRIKYDNQSFRNLLIKCQRDKNDALIHFYSSIAQIQANLLMNHPLIDHIVIFENYPIEESMSSMKFTTELGLSISDVETEEQTDYDLNLVVVPSDGLDIEVKYNGEVFSDTYICTLMESINEVLSCVVENPDILLDDISVLSSSIKDRLVHRIDETHVEVDEHMTLDKCFEMAVKQYPDNTAVVFQNMSVSYTDLNWQANQIAYELRKKGIFEGDNVAVLMKRGMSLYAAILGVLKAGCVYVPLNSEYPDARIQYILNDCSAKAIIVDGVLEARVDENIIKINIDMLDDFTVGNVDLTNRRRTTDICYIIYTSGSTGQSKGVLVQHQNVLRVVKNTNYIDISSSDALLQLSNYAFDGSVFDIFGALLNGAKLVALTDDEILSSRSVADIIMREKVSISFMTTALFNVFVDTSIEALVGMKKILFGGERVSVAHVRKAFEILGRNKMIHVYGPTETAVFATFYPINNVSDMQNTIPIGKALLNTRLYVLNECKELLPNGVAGELYIGGTSVALGYLNKEELNNERFIDNPWVPGEKIYKTGDLVIRNEDDDIVFLDRIDNQVKIRGFRIELGEIESEILKNQSVKDTFVMAVKDQNGNSVGLCSYYVSDKEVSSKVLKEKLAETLPLYMLPDYFIRLDEMPLTPNKKIDISKLPKIEESSYEFMEDKQFVEARTEYEKTIAKIWEEVLGKSCISVDDNFIEIGGHSLNAMNVVARINKTFEKDISIREFMELGTISKIANFLEKQDCVTYEMLEKAEIKDLYELSAQQKRMYAIWANDKKNIAYNMPSAFILYDEIDLNVLKEVLNNIVKRHSALRTVFPIIDGKVYQKILEEINMDVSIIDKQDSKQTVEEIVLEMIQAFDLTRGPLIRINVAYIGGGKTILFIDIHHIISDGVTTSVIVDELIKGFNGEKLEEVKYQYIDYSEYENSSKFAEKIAKQEEFWKKQFEDEVPVLNLPSDFKREQNPSFHGEKLRVELDNDTSRIIKDYIRNTKSTSYIYFMSCLSLFLYKITNQDDIIIGSPVSGRSFAELSNIVGMFVNTIVVRNKIDSQMTIGNFMEENKKNIMDFLNNQEYPFDNLVSLISYNREPGRNPLFDVMFAMQNIDIDEFRIGEKKLETLKFDDGIEKFDITIQAFETDKYFLEMSYNTSLWKKSTMVSYAEYLSALLSYICRNMETKICDLSVVSEKQLLEIEKEEKVLKKEYPYEKTLERYFEEIVAEYPDKVAIRYNNASMTYQKLNHRANQLAWELKKQGVKEGDRIAILVERGIDVYVAILAVLKIGCIYVPINDEYPDDRIKYILKDCNVAMSIINKVYFDKMNISEKTIILDQMDLSNNDNSNPMNRRNLDDVCYIIYTSGSTGQAKGALVQHKNVIRVVKDTNYITITPDDCMLQLSSYAFDGSVFDIFGSLLNGAELIAVDKDTLLSAEKIVNVIQECGVTISFMTTALFNVLVDINASALKNIKKILFGGERVSFFHVKKAFDNIGAGKLMHVYGPTETAVFATYYEINKICDNQITIPIGRALTNTKLIVLDENLKVVPDGVPGELYIGGSAVSLGYLNREDITNERFIGIDINGTKEKYYKTGDLVRRNGDGEIEFLDRIDNQVKIRGYRIELGEIESEIIKCNEIKEAYVVPMKNRNGNSVGLCAYYVANYSIEKEKIRSSISRVLPQYMIPEYFIQVENMPLNANKKIDTKRLPEPSDDDRICETYVEPQTALEKVMAEVWMGVLGLEKISVHDNFFSIGGDSIKGIQIISRLKQRGISLEIKHLLNNSTIAQICDFVEENHMIVSQEAVVGNVDISPIQRYFIEQQKGTNINHFCQSITLFRNGGFKAHLVEEALQRLVEHHDALRMIYQKNNDDFTQKIRPVTANQVEVKEISILGVAAEETEEFVNQYAYSLQENISLEKGELVKALIIHDVDGSHLYILIHHFVVDGLSWRYIVEDFCNVYEGLEKKIPYELPPKTNSVKDWGIAVQKYAARPQDGELKYWKKINEAIPSKKNKFTEYMNQCNLVTEELDENITHLLLTDANKAWGTELNELLIAAVAFSFAKYTGQQDIAINLEGHGREKIAEDIDITRTVGWFTSIYPVVVNTLLAKKNDLSKYILETRDMLRLVPNKGVGYGILKYMNDESGLSNRKPEICFNYLGDIDSVINQEEISLSPIIIKGDIGDAIYSMYEIDVSCVIKNHKLEFNVAHTKHLEKETVQLILSDLKQVLKDIALTSVHLITETQMSMSEIDAIHNSPFTLLLNEKVERNVFVFPPHMPKIAYSIVYKNLSMYINNYSFYMFNFLESNKIIDCYVDKVKELQKDGPYVLMGYSFGGALAFDVANRLISEGYEVSDVILIDSYVVEEDSFSNIDLELVRENVKTSLSTQYADVITDRQFINEIADNFINYYVYTKDFVNTNVALPTNIHLIRGEGGVPNIKDTRHMWKSLTTKQYLEYEGIGEHNVMLSGQNLNHNGKIVEMILNKIERNA